MSIDTVSVHGIVGVRVNIMSKYTVYVHGITPAIPCTETVSIDMILITDPLFLYTELLGSLFNIMSIDTVSVHGIAGLLV
jgi:hypothetical protein